MFGGGRLGQSGMQKIAGRLLETDAMDHLTRVLAQSEHELLQAAQALDEAHGNDTIQNVPNIEERQAALKSLLRALVTESLDDVWIEEIAPELLDNPDRAKEYLGMDAEKWDAQRERWADSYRENGADGTDEQLAAYHVRQTFGVDMEEFEDRVVNWNAGEEAEDLFAGNFRACVTAMRRAAEAAGVDPDAAGVREP